MARAEEKMPIPFAFSILDWHFAGQFFGPELAILEIRSTPAKDRAIPPQALALKEQLTDYLSGKRVRFDLALARAPTTMQGKLREALLALPRGQTLTYGEMAARLGMPGGAQAVGQALGKNPLPIVVPCHRVVAKGGLGGYTPDIRYKKRLLALEGVSENLG